MSSTALKKAEDFSTSTKLNESNLHDYQRRAVEFIHANEAAFLLMDMGLGKTVSVLTAARTLLDELSVLKVLVIAPLRVAKATWPDEIAVWSHTQDTTFASLCTDRDRREKLVDTDDSEIHIINRENVQWLVSHCAKSDYWPYDMVVIDESSSFKAPNTKRFRALKKVRKHIERMVLLTGTPASNGLLDLWPQAWLLDMGDALGRTFTSYKDKWFESDYSGFKYTPREGADDEIHEAMAPLSIRLAEADYLKMPERIDNYIPVELPTKLRDQYAALERDSMLVLESDTVTALSAAAVSNKLLQFSGGSLYHTDADTLDRKVIHLHDLKIDALKSIVDEAAGQPVLVAYNYTSERDAIMKAFKSSGLNVEALGKSAEQIHRWNDGGIDLFVCHAASAGHGLNLQRGGSIAVWFGLPWSLELYQQFNKRLHRQGQKRPVFIHHITATATIDQTVIDALGDKNMTQAKLLDALRSDIAGRVG